MFKVHQGATVLPVTLESPDYAFGNATMPAISASATRDASGRVHLSLANADPNRSFPVTVKLAGIEAKAISGRVLTAPSINAHNTFDSPDTVSPKDFDDATLKGDMLEVNLPGKSVVVIELR
jgi:alpha-N-arabinofuranosidase